MLKNKAKMDVLAYNNRIDYGQALMPDEGWTTSWAIGTTFSLDLDVLLTVPMALFHRHDLQKIPDMSNLQADMLDSLEKVKDRMFVFVQQNNIKAMKKYSLLISFLDHNIREMPLEMISQSFHPKLWLIRYEKDSSFKYRLIVMSRNITTATDFDISTVMEGECIQEITVSNDSLISFMTSLMNIRDEKTCCTIRKQICKELKKIKFSAPTPFQEDYYEFYPHMKTLGVCPLIAPYFKYKNLMVVSPFIDDASLAMLENNADKKPILISRFEQLEKCNPNILKTWDCYSWASLIADEDDMDAECNISLHAKIYLMETRMHHLGSLSTDRKNWNYWYLGSTNCTTAGMRENYEALLQLRSDNKSLSVNHTFNALFKSNLIIKYNITSDEDFNKRNNEQDKLKSLERKMRECLFELSNLHIFASVAGPNNTNKYHVSIVCDKKIWLKYHNKYCNDFRITATLPTGTNEIWNLLEKDSIKFHPILCQELSRFLKITVKLKGQSSIPEKSFLVDTKMDIPQQRHNNVIEQILDTDEKILRYLLFILDNDMSEKDQYIGKDKNYHSGKTSTSAWGQYTLPVYEKLLLAASRDRVALKEFISKAEKLKDCKSDKKSILNDDFFKMLEMFKKYV